MNTNLAPSRNTFTCCPLCLDANVRPVAGFERQCLSRCCGCKLVFDYRVPTPQELFEYYRQYSYGSLKPCPSATLASFDRLLSEFDDYRHAGTILDIGCGQGDFLEAARRRGWDAQGSEFSEAAVGLCRSRGLSVQQGSLAQSPFGCGSFDVITAFEVLEHVNEPNELLSQVRRLLRPGGLFYLTTPNFDSVLRYAERSAFAMLCYPEHLCFYTKSSLQELARLHRFRVTRLRTTGVDLRRARNLARRRKTQSAATDQPAQRVDVDALRSRFNTNRSLGLVKSSVNAVLSFTGLGDTLKGYLVKQA